MKSITITATDLLGQVKDAKEAGLKAKIVSESDNIIELTGSKTELIEFLQTEGFEDLEENFPALYESVTSKSFGQFLIENSTDDAEKSLKAIIGFLKDQDSLDDDGKEMLKMAEGIMDFFKKNGSFSPGHASWIYKTSKALF